MERVNDFITYSNITLKDWVEIYSTKKSYYQIGFSSIVNPIAAAIL